MLSLKTPFKRPGTLTIPVVTLSSVPGKPGRLFQPVAAEANLILLLLVYVLSNPEPPLCTIRVQKTPI